MEIRGKKIILRPIKMTDAPRFVKWLSDPEVNQFTTRKSVTLKEEKQWIRGHVKTRKTELHFAVDTLDGVHIGTIALFLDLRDKNARFGILIGDKNYWNRGYGTDAARTIINYGFKTLKLHRIYLQVYETNPRAIKVYKRLGFRLEGRSREHVLKNGKFRDTLHMGMLRKEWKIYR